LTTGRGAEDGILKGSDLIKNVGRPMSEFRTCLHVPWWNSALCALRVN
jgi:hypothetical protein